MSALLKQDWVLNGAVLILLAIGLITLWSIDPSFFWRQLLWLAISVAVFVIIVIFDLRSLSGSAWFIFIFYGLVLVMLLATLVFAPQIRNTRSWLVVGPLQFQPSEFSKVALIFLLAYFFARQHIAIAHLSTVIKSFAYAVVPGILIFLQPDMGSLLVLLAIWCGFLLVSGIRWKHILVGLIIIAVASFFAWHFVLQPYHKERITGLFNPNYDPLGVNYSVIQSKIAIGSAGFFGKGFRQGTQTQLNFLPEAQSDFIFAAFVEEWGLAGGIIFLAAFFIVIWRILLAGLRAKINFLRYLTLGSVILFLTHFLFNIGSALGLMPVVGVPLSFVSYGGSHLLVSFMLLGVVQGIVARSSFLT